MLIHLTAPVRLGMQIAFGRVRRKTAPTGPGKWVVSNLDGSNLLLLGFSLFRSRRFQRRVRGGPDKILRRGCR